jgi:hypothetical protein
MIPPPERVERIVATAVDILTRYPDLTVEQGLRLAWTDDLLMYGGSGPTPKGILGVSPISRHAHE